MYRTAPHRTAARLATHLDRRHIHLHLAVGKVHEVRHEPLDTVRRPRARHIAAVERVGDRRDKVEPCQTRRLAVLHRVEQKHLALEGRAVRDRSPDAA